MAKQRIRYTACISQCKSVSNFKNKLEQNGSHLWGDNKRSKAMMVRAKHGFRLKMVINFDSDVAKQAFFLVRIVAAQLWLSLPDALVNSCYRRANFCLPASVTVSACGILSRLCACSVWLQCSARKKVRENSWLAVWNLNLSGEVKGRSWACALNTRTCGSSRIHVIFPTFSFNATHVSACNMICHLRWK